MSKRSQLIRDSYEVEIVNVLYQRVPFLIYPGRITCAEYPSSDRGYRIAVATNVRSQQHRFLGRLYQGGDSQS